MTPPRPDFDLGAALVGLLHADARRLALLAAVEALALPDGWIGAGFVRAAVWDAGHGRPAADPADDIDVVWFDPTRATADHDRALEARLATLAPAVRWSVKNQARMHARNGDPPYRSTADALRHWPETATAVAVRRRDGALDWLAPFGLDDLFAMTIRPTPAFAGDRRTVVLDRVRDKRWLERWPLARLAPPLA
ncbi:MAG: nucleotidyltransferase family protein [Proteobacteria bacterium]|nr:nucleotidyltransferase family protein [Pseudomonadota bacterium]